MTNRRNAKFQRFPGLGMESVQCQSKFSSVQNAAKCNSDAEIVISLAVLSAAQNRFNVLCVIDGGLGLRWRNCDTTESAFDDGVWCSLRILRVRVAFFAKIRSDGTVMPLYDNPRHLSPAMLRYIWKRRFDDRTFWAGVLSLVGKGLATLHSGTGEAVIQATSAANLAQVLPKEEEILLRELVGCHTRKGSLINMLNGRTIRAVRDMAECLRRDAVGEWFLENRHCVIAGIVLSAAALCIMASPHYKDQWGALILGLAVMAPGAFYFFFVSLRVWDVIVAMKHSCDWAVLRRETLLLTMLFPCMAAIILGSVTIGGTFGWQVVAATLFFGILNTVFFQLIKAPTPEGRHLLAEIEGFRLFLKSVERFPMERSDEPTDHAGLYEKYLPYALALEVEQAWGDRFVALTSTYHENAGMKGAEAFYLGMWNGKPLEIIYKPEARRGRAF